MPKLTLSVDAEVVRRAKVYAEGRGVSVSALVETFLDLVARGRSSEEETPPVLARLRGVLRDADVEAHRAYLERKHLG
ncbi:MAG: DUF6364 family protein [Vicinamibacterales bacterium]|nr:DUF6364 family protein [Vicinamibacterales bacterium]